MKNIAVMLCAALSLCCALRAQDAPAEKSAKLQLTLDEARRIAVEQNPTLAIARGNLLAAEAAITAAQSAYYPTLDLDARYTRVRDYQTTRPIRADFGYDRYNLGLTGTWTIFTGGARRYAELVARLGGQSALADCDEAQNSMDISKQDAEFNRQLESDARERNRMGTAKTSEVLNFQYQVEFAEVNYISAESHWRRACVALGKLLVMDQEQIWDGIELADPDEAEASAFDAGVDSLLEYAKQHRPDIIRARQAVQAADYAVKLAQSDWAPTIYGFANYGFQRDHSARVGRRFDRGINFGIAAGWNIFDGFATEAAVAKAKASRQVAQSALDSALLELESELRQEAITLESSRRTLAQQTKLHQIAQEIRDLVREEYLGGTATITRLNEVQTDLTNAALALSNARLAMFNNVERLKAATAMNLEPAK